MLSDKVAQQPRAELDRLHDYEVVHTPPPRGPIGLVDRTSRLVTAAFLRSAARVEAL